MRYLGDKMDSFGDIGKMEVRERNIKDSFESSGLYNWIDIDFYNN